MGVFGCLSIFWSKLKSLIDFFPTRITNDTSPTCSSHFEGSSGSVVAYLLWEEYLFPAVDRVLMDLHGHLSSLFLLAGSFYGSNRHLLVGTASTSPMLRPVLTFHHPATPLALN